MKTIRNTNSSPALRAVILAFALSAVCALPLIAQVVTTAPPLSREGEAPASTAKTNVPSGLRTDPLYAPPQVAEKDEDIHFGLMTTNRQGRLDYLQPAKRRFRYRGSDYLVAIDNNVIGDGGEAYTHAWLYTYNKAFKQWRCFQATHFRRFSVIDAELDVKKGQILIKCIGNESGKGTVLTMFNLEATSDDAAYVRSTPFPHKNESR